MEVIPKTGPGFNASSFATRAFDFLEETITHQFFCIICVMLKQKWYFFTPAEIRDSNISCDF